jgi:hypothetical protein
MPNRPRHALATTLYLTAFALAGCAGGAPPPGAKSADTVPEPDTIEEAQAQLERARAELEPGGPKSESTPSSVAPEAPSPPPPPPSTSAAGAAGGASASERMGAAPECVTLCRAISSMRRAVSAICRMAGEGDARCTDAKKVLQESEGRVVSCGC